MEKSNKRGKIPQSDWPLIMARYEAGETLASIARTYDCSPPAISYVVSRIRERQPGAASPPAGSTEPQLIKTPAIESTFGIAKPQRSGGPPPVAALPTAARLGARPWAGEPARRDEQPPRLEAAGQGEHRDAMPQREMNGVA